MRLIAFVLVFISWFPGTSIANNQDTGFKKVIRIICHNSLLADLDASDESLRISNAYARESERTGIDRGLLLAIGLNESDLRPDVVNVSRTSQGLTAVDVGLMGVRCVFRGRPYPNKRCTNGYVKGLTLGALMRPEKNIEVGATMLRDLRDQKTIVRAGGQRMACPHRSHPYFAHYNWGNRVFYTGHAAEYPRRVTMFAHMLARVTGQLAPDVAKTPRRLTYSRERYNSLAKRFAQYTGLCPAEPTPALYRSARTTPYAATVDVSTPSAKPM